MQVWAVLYRPSLFPDEGFDPRFYKLFEKSLLCVDSESRTRIRRFYHRADGCRTLIGRLLVRTMLKERGVSANDLIFAVTPEGKPYIASQVSVPPLAYNITHDNNLVAMAFGHGLRNPPAFSIGIDVMKVRIPGRESLNSFINTVGDQLTPLEHQLVKVGIPEKERLERFFWMWTLKEAYTKALGMGLGFDFRRVEFDVVSRTVRVDGAIPGGWRFNLFTVLDKDDIYQGVVAEFIDELETEVLEVEENPSWLKVYDAVDFTENAVNVL